MKQSLVLVLFSSLTLAGCASTMPMTGGMLDDHTTTTANCGVGNYTFRTTTTTCGTTTTTTATTDTTPTTTTTTASTTPVSTVATMTGNKIEISKQVTFKTGSAKLTTQGMMVLDEVAKVITANATTIGKIDIEGHTDHTGNPTKNMALSEARANTVKMYLEQKGVDTNMLTAKGYGTTKPKFDPATATKTETAANRRVEFTVETTTTRN